MVRLIVLQKLSMCVMMGKWKTLKCGNRSTETEVWKPKCGSEKKSRLSVSSALLTHVKALQPKDDSIAVR